MLEVREVTLAYGDLIAVHDCSLHVEKGEVVGVVGRNGAGKSTLFKAILGQVPISGGDIRFRNSSIVDKPTEAICADGLSLVPEGLNTFRSLTVLENLMIGVGSRQATAERERRLADAYSLFPILKTRMHIIAGNLSGGEQQQLALAQAILADPQVLMVDEPSLGLAPKIVEEVYAVFRRLKSQGRTLLIVEERMARILTLADRVYVMRNGKIEFEGDTARHEHRAKLEEAYFGMVDSA